MSDAYMLRDHDDDWWLSDNGETFTVLLNTLTGDLYDSPSNFVGKSIDYIKVCHGIRDDGTTTPDPYPDFTEHIAEPLRTMDGAFITRDSGERGVFESGMMREPEAGKPRFDLLIPDGVPYEAQFLTRMAALMARGAEKYEDRNWEQGNSDKELRRMKSSAFRHFMEWYCGEADEDHAAGLVFNVLGHETINYKINNALREG